MFIVNLQLTLQVTLAPPPDLVVISVMANDNYITGDTMTVVYNISNVGAGETDESYWQDQVVSCMQLTMIKIVMQNLILHNKTKS